MKRQFTTKLFVRDPWFGFQIQSNYMPKASMEVIASTKFDYRSNKKASAITIPGDKYFFPKVSLLSKCCIFACNYLNFSNSFIEFVVE